MKKILPFLMLLMLSNSLESFCQPSVYVFNNQYFEMEYGCITGLSTYEIDFMVFKITNLELDESYRIYPDTSTIFDETEYDFGMPDPWFRYSPTHWYWKSEATIDTVILGFSGYYSNLELGASEWIDFCIHIYPSGPGDIGWANFNIVEPDPPVEISGPSLPCSNPVSFNLVNMPTPYTSATWEIKQGEVTKASGSGSTASANNLTDGPAEVIFTIHFSCGLKDLTYKKDFWFGKPILNYVTGPDEGYIYNTYTFYAYPQRNPLSQAEYTWILNPLLNNDVRPYYDYADISFYDAWEGYQVVARAENTCGMTDWALTNITIYDDGERFLMSPNPASEIVTITVVKPSKSGIKTEETKSEDVNTIYTIRIIDFYGNLHYSTTRSGPSFTISVNNIKDGDYIVQINNGKRITNLRLVIKR